MNDDYDNNNSSYGQRRLCFVSLPLNFDFIFLSVAEMGSKGQAYHLTSWGYRAELRAVLGPGYAYVTACHLILHERTVKATFNTPCELLGGY